MKDKSEMMSGRLPDGTETNSNKVYINAWERFTKPIEVMTGLSHIAFDPNVQFFDPKAQDRAITLPKWFIELLNKYYREVHDEYYEMMNEGS